jgi:hypothetical protein
MMKRILLIKVSFIMALYTQVQPVKLFYQYQNDNLLANDILPKEKEVTNCICKAVSLGTVSSRNSRVGLTSLCLWTLV